MSPENTIRVPLFVSSTNEMNPPTDNSFFIPVQGGNAVGSRIQEDGRLRYIDVSNPQVLEELRTRLQEKGIA